MNRMNGLEMLGRKGGQMGGPMPMPMMGQPMMAPREMPMDDGDDMDGRAKKRDGKKKRGGLERLGKHGGGHR